MTGAPSAYAGRTIVFGTMHGKERLAANAFAHRLDATVIAPDHFDTDQLGTFAGDVARTLSPLTAATVKARLGMQITGLPYGLASEGSFASSLIGVETTEILVFVDADRGLEIVEQSFGSSELLVGRPVDTVGDALAYAETIGFPHQGVLLQARHDCGVVIHKSIGTTAALAELAAHALDEEMALTVLPDHRAHRSPARAERIALLCDRMARRLATRCPECATPGFGLVDVERGLPCAMCGNLTAAIAADVIGCAVCGERHRRPRAVRSADPAGCDHCNP